MINKTSYMGTSVKKKTSLFFKQVTLLTGINISICKNNFNLKFYWGFSFNSIN